jgi:hypothetical protein
VSSILIQVADAIAHELNGKAFSFEFEAARAYADFDEQLLSDMLRAEVVPVGPLPTELDGRYSVAYQCSADIVLRKRFTPDDMEQVSGMDAARVKPCVVDPYVALVEEINEWLIAKRLTDMEDAVWRETSIVAAVVHKHLREWQQFTGILRVTYDVSKCLA